jgi:hypothetical protein
LTPYTLAAKVASIRYPHVGQRCKLRNAEGVKEVQLPIALCRKGILYISTGDGSIFFVTRLADMVPAPGCLATGEHR